jgi:hypothetical protein
MNKTTKWFVSWFLASGCFGVIFGLVLAHLLSIHLIRPQTLVVLWPTSIAGIADPADTWDIVLVAVFEFGGNFVLYGVLGTVIGWCFQRKQGPASRDPQ